MDFRLIKKILVYYHYGLKYKLKVILETDSLLIFKIVFLAQLNEPLYKLIAFAFQSGFVAPILIHCLPMAE
jgi:hypothetical protein